MPTYLKIEGLRAVEAALRELPNATAKGVLRRVGKKRLKPVADEYRSRVRVDKGDLRDSIGVGTQLTRRQRSIHRRETKNKRAAVEIFAGAGGLVQAITEEFGTVDQKPHPALRPAWDAHKESVLKGLQEDLWNEIAATVKRRARRAARADAEKT